MICPKTSSLSPKREQVEEEMERDCDIINAGTTWSCLWWPVTGMIWVHLLHTKCLHIFLTEIFYSIFCLLSFMFLRGHPCVMIEYMWVRETTDTNRQRLKLRRRRNQSFQAFKFSFQPLTLIWLLLTLISQEFFFETPIGPWVRRDINLTSHSWSYGT